MTEKSGGDVVSSSSEFDVQGDLQETNVFQINGIHLTFMKIISYFYKMKALFFVI